VAGNAQRPLPCRLQLGFLFIRAALVYWLEVFPRVKAEVLACQRRARTIPDESLRAIALKVQRSKRGNLEGAAAFAAFVPHRHRMAVVRAQVALQAIYDYVDTLSEQPHHDPVSNSQQLHQALRQALEPTRLQLDYYAHDPSREDGQYLQAIVETTQAALNVLPARASIATAASCFAERIISYQSFNVPPSPGTDDLLKTWATRETPAGLDLRWWETAASAGSSLGIFVLIALAATPGLTTPEIQAIEEAYFPWIGALHSLLDSLIDMEEDGRAGERNLVAQYPSEYEAACRMRMLASESRRRIELLPNAPHHQLVLSGMVGFYLSAPEAHLPAARLLTRELLSASGDLADLARLMLRVRQHLR
jgi:tetraprenyl-beta-curcumene synthase